MFQISNVTIIIIITITIMMVMTREAMVGTETFQPKHVLIATWKNVSFAGGIPTARHFIFVYVDICLAFDIGNQNSTPGVSPTHSKLSSSLMRFAPFSTPTISPT